MNITGSDCEDILEKELLGQSFRFLEHEIVKIGSFLGFLGEYHQIKIKYEFDGKIKTSSYFAKSLPTSNDVERKIQLEQGFHLKEIKLYRDVFSELALPNDDWCPKFLIAKDDVLVLEDLTIRGYKTLPFRFELQKSHLNVALTTLAKFHSRSFIYEAEHPLKRIVHEFAVVLSDKGFIATNPWLQNGYRVIDKVAQKNGCFEKFDIRDKLYEKLGEFLIRMNEPENDIVKVLSHSDPWKNNLMFDGDLENPAHCILLDFQIVKYLPLPIDALMLIFMNTRRKSREKTLEAYLNLYYDELKAELSNHSIGIEQVVGYRKFMESIDYFKLVALIYKAISTMITFIPTETYTTMTSAEYDQFTIHDRFVVVSHLMDTDDFYCENVAEAVEELIEYLATSV